MKAKKSIAAMARAAEIPSIMNMNALCGKGKIIEEHDNIPGFRDHDVYTDFSEKYQLAETQKFDYAL